MSVAVLKDLCQERNIKKIAMVDDVFDVPSPNGLDRVRYSKFRQSYNSDPNLRKALARVSGMTSVETLPSFDDLGEEELEILWKSTWKQQLGGRKLRENYAQALRELFQGHQYNVLEMLDTVIELLSLFRDDLIPNGSVTVHGTDYDADMVARGQIVLIDYFLGEDLSATEALEKTVEVVSNVVRAARQAGRPAPSFLLVSGRPEEIDAEKFRKSAQLMKSRFRFFGKNALSSNQIQNLVNLHDLIDASDRTVIIEGLIEDWYKGASKAIDEVRQQMLNLDVSDLVYLDCFRLVYEGTSIGNYLQWFMTAFLNARVTGKLTKKVWHQAESIRLSSIVDEEGHLDNRALIKTFDGPSDVIVHAYGEILFDETRGTADYAFPHRLPGHDLVEGDLFVRPKGRDRKGYEGAEVRLVITPSSDLLPRAPNQPPSGESVLLLPGILKRMEREDKKINLTKVYSVRVKERQEMCLLRVEWDFRRPISVGWAKMRDAGPGIGFKRLGRIRDLYFHKIRDEFANHFSRIGTVVAPLFPHPRSGKVFISTMDGKRFEPVLCFSSADGFVWEIGPVRVEGNSSEVYVYQASHQFVETLSQTLRGLDQEKPELIESFARSLEHLKNIETYMDLLRPMAPGARGTGGSVEFKKATKRSDVKLNSNAKLLIVPFAD